MVTRTQYLEALEIIDQYHWQSISMEGSEKRETVRDWTMRTMNALSKRLQGTLEDAGENIEYIDELTETTFRSIRQAGNKTWTEFADLRARELQLIEDRRIAELTKKT